jgi:hypothetical protein
MKSVFWVLGMALAVAGCGGSNNSSSTQASAAPGASAQPSIPGGEAATPALPLYPGATKNALVGDMTLNRCGHKIRELTYDVKADGKTVTAWYADRIPGSIRIEMTNPLGGGASISSTEFFEPGGGAVATVSETHMPGDRTNPAAGVHVTLGTLDPAFSSSELQTMQAAMGSDPAAKQLALAQMKAKCGPSSAPAGR